MKSLFTAFLLLILVTGCTGNNESQVPAETENTYDAYLFAYFAGNGPGEEAVHYALSPDGFNYRALNNNEAVISPDTVSTTGGIRDPHLLRSPDGDTFYMVVTDLYVPDMGWNNYAMVMLKSDDLVNWSSSVVNMPETFPEFSEVNRVWAPQTFYDEQEDKYMVYFSMLEPGSYDKIYYAYANEDFTGFESAPKQLFYNADSIATIDGDIVKKDGKYHLFYKTEGGAQGIAKAISDSLTGGYQNLPGDVDQTEERVEGSGTFKLNGTDTYILMYDVYIEKSYQFTESTDLTNFTVIDDSISMDFDPRHGSVLPITAEEAQRLLDTWGSPELEEFMAPALK